MRFSEKFSTALRAFLDGNKRKAHKQGVFAGIAVIAGAQPVAPEAGALIKSDGGVVSGADLKLETRCPGVLRPFHYACKEFAPEA